MATVRVKGLIGGRNAVDVFVDSISATRG